MDRTSRGIFAAMALTAFFVNGPCPAQTASRAVNKTCGPTKVTLQCTANSPRCRETTLSISDAKGAVTHISARPKGLENYTPVGIACARAADGANYLIVQYGERPTGCAFCEWYHLYSLKGHLLTHSDPAIFTDKALPEGQQQYPNNAEYNAISKRLDLDEQDIQLIR